MSEFIEFTESDQTFELNFGEVQVATDGGFEGGYNAGIEESKKSLTEKEITANGEYLPADGKLGFSKVVVNVADENGSYNEGYKDGSTDGYNNALEKLTEITIDKDGTYEPTGDNIGFKKVVVDTSVKPTQPLEINVPDIIAKGTSVYTFNIDNEWVLVSGSATSSGVWLCNTVNNTCEKIISSLYDWKYFYKVKDKIVISSSYQNSGLWVYDHNTKTCEKKLSGGYSYTKACLINDTLLLTGSGKDCFVRFDYETDLFEVYYDPNGDGLPVMAFYQYGNKLLLNCSVSGVYLYNNLDKSLVTIKPKTTSYSPNVRQTEHGTLIFYYDGTAYSLELYDENFDTPLSRVTINSTDMGRVIEHENGELYIRSRSSDKGIYWFDYANKTIEKVYDEGYSLQSSYTKIFDKYIFFVCSNSALAGCVLFNTETKEVIRPLTTGSYFLATPVCDKLVLTHSGTTYKGLYVYDIATRELVTLNTTSYITGGYSAKAYQLKDRIIAAFSNYIFSINLADNTYKSVNTSSLDASRVEFLATENKVFINTQGSIANVRFYDYETDSFVSLASSGEIYNKTYNVYKLDGENCYAYNEDKTKNPYTLYYDSDKKQWLIHKYYLGEI